MPTTNFSSGTVITSTWLNEVDEHVFNGHGNVIYVTDQAYGAVGDGITDDTAAVQLALDAAEASNGYVVFTKIFAISEYIIVRNGVRGLIGENGGGIKCINTTLDAGILLIGPESGAASAVDNCTVQGLTIDCNNSLVTTNGIFGQNSTNCKIIGNRIINRKTGHGIFFYSYEGAAACQGNIVANNYVQGDQATFAAEVSYLSISFGSEIAGLVGYASMADYWKINFATVESTVPSFNNLIANNIILGGQYGIALSDARYTTVIGNRINGVVRGVSAQATCFANLISGNYVLDCRSSGVHLAYNATYNQVSGNYIYTTISPNGEALLQAYVGCNNNSFTDNYVCSFGGAGAQYFAYTAVHSNYNEFSRNTFVGQVTRACMAVESAWDNTITNPASYSTGKGSTVNLFANAGMTGNIFANNTVTTSSAVPLLFVGQVSDGTGNFALSGTKVIGNITTNNIPSAMLELFEEHSSSLSTITMVDNQFDPSATAAKFVLPRGREHFARCDGNTVLDESSGPVSFTSLDTTPSVAVGQWFQFANGSATSVTMFDGGADGQTITIRLDSNTTIVHNSSNIKLSGAANITGRSSDDHVTFRRISGIWFEIARSW